MDFLLKVGQAKYINDMYEKEYLFFNTLASFRTNEKDQVGRSDPREANTKNKQVTNFELKIPGRETIKFNEVFTKHNCQFHEHPAVIPNNICSLFILKFDENLKYKAIDEKALHLGERTLII